MKRILTAADKAQILRLRASGLSTEYIAARLGISRETARRVVKSGQAHAPIQRCLTTDERDQLRRLYFGDIKYTQRELAMLYRISRGTVQRIVTEAYRAAKAAKRKESETL